MERPTPAIYRTRITHLRQAPVNHYFETRSYSWYVDIDDLPRLPRWLRPVARFDARDHFDGPESETLRQRVDGCLARHGAAAGGQITALLQPRVLGFVFNPLTFYWCHDCHGVLRHVVVEVHNRRGERHGYVLASASAPVLVRKRLYATPFHPVDGHYVIRAPRPDLQLDISVSLYRGEQPAFVATMHGRRRRVCTAEVLRCQLVVPAAPLLARLETWLQNAILWLRGVPRIPWRPMTDPRPAIPTVRVDVTDRRERRTMTATAAARLPLHDPIAAGDQRPGHVAAPGRRSRRRRVRRLLRSDAGTRVRIGDPGGA